MRAINVWAWQSQMTEYNSPRVPICSDGSSAVNRSERLSTMLTTPWVNEPGWHIGVPYSSLSDLAQQLAEVELPDYIRGPRTLQRGEIQTLAIDCHGSDGVFYPEGLPGVAVGVQRRSGRIRNNLDQHSEALNDIGLFTASASRTAQVPTLQRGFPRQAEMSASTILIMACNSAAGAVGTELVRQLSFRWPDREVVSFSTTVVFPNLPPTEDPVSGGACIPPLSLDSGVHGLRSRDMAEWRESVVQNNPTQMPLADASAANAKSAKNGSIVRWPGNETRPRAELNPETDGSTAEFSGRPRGNGGRRVVSTNRLRQFA